MARYRGAVDAAMYPWYVSGFNETSINGAYLAHEARHSGGNDLDVKRCLYIQQNWISTGATRDAMADDLAARMQIPGWARYRDRPIVGLFMDSGVLADPTSWLAFKARLPADVWVIALGDATPTQLTNAAANTWASYGPNGSSLSPNGQHAWSDQLTANQADWGSKCPACITTLSYTLGGDQRPRRSDPLGTVTAYADPPTLVEWMAAIAQASPLLEVVIYAGTEPTEGTTSLWGTAQKNSIYTDGLRFVRTAPGSRPTTYVDKISTRSLGFTRGGAPVWSRTTLAGGAVSGAFDSETVSLTAATDTLTVTHLYTTRFRMLGQRGSGGGNCTITLDGGAPSVVDTSTGSGQQQLIYDSGVLSEGSHTIVLAGHAANIGTACVTNLLEVTQNPQSIPGYTPRP